MRKLWKPPEVWHKAAAKVARLRPDLAAAVHTPADAHPGEVVLRPAGRP